MTNKMTISISAISTTIIPPTPANTAAGTPLSFVDDSVAFISVGVTVGPGMVYVWVLGVMVKVCVHDIQWFYQLVCQKVCNHKSRFENE